MAKKSPPVRAADVLLPLANVMPELGSKYQPNHLLRQKNRSINASAPQVLGCSPGCVVGAVDLFVDGQGALGVLQGSRQIALVLQDQADVVGVAGHVGVVGAVDLFVDG